MVRSVPELAVLRTIPRELPDPAAPCQYAQSLTEYGRTLLVRLRMTPGKSFEDALIDSKARLLDRYSRCKADALAPHQNAAGNDEHQCVNDALDQTLVLINELARNTLPPRKLGKLRSAELEDDAPRRMALGLAFEPTQIQPQPPIDPLPTRIVRFDE